MNNNENMRITIKDVAKEAMVSVSTVSRFISNNGYVGKQKREQIANAISKLNFMPSEIARSMVNGSSGVVGVIVPDISNVFYSDIVKEIECALWDRGICLMLCNCQNSTQKAQCFIKTLISRNTMGMILMSIDILDEKILQQVEACLPTVTVECNLQHFDNVSVDNFTGAYDATEYIAKKGHKKIAFIGVNDASNSTLERLNGYEKAMEANGLPLNEDYIVHLRDNCTTGYQMAKKVLSLQDAPTAIVAINDHIATQAYLAIREMGLIVGEDISICGFDNISLAHVVSPSLASVEFSLKDLSAKVVKLLLKRMQGKGNSDIEKVIILTKFIAKDSICKVKGELI